MTAPRTPPPPRSVRRKHRAPGVEAPGRSRPMTNALVVVRALATADRPLSVVDLASVTRLPVHTVRRALRSLDVAGWPLEMRAVEVEGRRGGEMKRVYTLPEQAEAVRLRVLAQPIEDAFEGRPDLRALYDCVLPLSGRPQHRVRLPSARVGGMWLQPDVGLSFLLAARFSLDVAARTGWSAEVALPVMYLQRHAFEVGLKDLIHACRVIRLDRLHYEAVTKNPKAKSQKRAKATIGHDLSTLVRTLAAALSTINYGDVPAEIVRMADMLRAIETPPNPGPKIDGTRHRYATDQEGHRSFPEPTESNLGDVQEQLETLFARQFAYSEGADVNTNLMVALAIEGQDLDNRTLAITGWK